MIWDRLVELARTHTLRLARESTQRSEGHRHEAEGHDESQQDSS